MPNACFPTPKDHEESRGFPEKSFQFSAGLDMVFNALCMGDFVHSLIDCPHPHDNNNTRAPTLVVALE